MTERADHDLLALCMRLYFDEDISRDIVENLRQRGFDVQSARPQADLTAASSSLNAVPARPLSSINCSIFWTL